MPAYRWNPTTPAGQETASHGEQQAGCAERAEHDEPFLISDDQPVGLERGEDNTPQPAIQPARSEGRFQCDRCPRSFAQQHAVKYVAFGPFSCPKTNLGASTHLGRQHERPESCRCAHCGYTAQYKKDLRRHVQDKHPALSEHQSMSKYFCPAPGCRFSEGRHEGHSRKDNLNRHIRTVHLGMGQLP